MGTITIPSIDDVISAIRAGHYDADDLDRMRDETRTARKTAAADFGRTLKAGDRVRLTGALSPKYLIGLLGRVSATGSSHTRIAIDLDPNQDTGRYSPEQLRVPPACLERV